MYKIVLFGGTAEGRVIAEYLSDKGVPSLVCVATEPAMSAESHHHHHGHGDA